MGRVLLAAVATAAIAACGGAAGGSSGSQGDTEGDLARSLGADACDGGGSRSANADAADGTPSQPRVVVPAVLPVRRVECGGENEDPEAAAKRFRDAAATADGPVVFAGSRWAAMAPAAAWTPEHIAANLNPGVLENVKRYPALPGAPMFATGMKMAALPDVMASYRPHFSRHNVTVATFLRRVGAPLPDATPADYGDVDDTTPPGWLDDDAAVLSYAGRLKEWGKALEKEFPLEGLVPEPDGDDEPIEVKPYVWLGQRGVRTLLHYDYYANFYLQVKGRKRFVVLPPSHHVELDLYPSLHPAHRSSQIANFTEALAVVPGAAADPAYEVELAPGDILYLPALWFHEVTTLDSPTISVNAWSEDRAWFAGLQAINVNLPFTADMMATQPDPGDAAADFWDQDADAEALAAKVQIMRAYVVLVLQQSGVVAAGGDGDDAGEAAVAEWLRAHLLERRYKAPAFDSAKAASTPPSRRFCRDLDVVQNLGSIEGGMAVHFLLTAVREVAESFDAERGTLGDGRFGMLVLTWVEGVLADAFGARHVFQAVHDLALC